MRCIAVLVDIDVNLDAVILWDADGQLLACAYVDGKITMSRPLAPGPLDSAVAEVREAWNIAFARVTRIQEWTQVGG